MRVELDIHLDVNGMHTFAYQPSQDEDALDVPKTQLGRWQSEYESFQVAYLRWKRMAEEIEEFALRAQNKGAHVVLSQVVHQKVRR